MRRATALPIIAAVVVTLSSGLALAGATQPSGNPQARAAAQRGLDYLARATAQWQEQNKCYGCHVQAVTLEAMTVGLSHQYTVPKSDLDRVLHGMLDISGGQRGANGFSVGGDAHHLIDSSTSFGGSALAHYDERVSGDLKKELVATAEKLLGFQNPDGSLRYSEQRRPVAAGALQSTTQALITWRQAQARTADTRWLVPIRKAEAWLTQQAKLLSDGRPADLQDVAHAIIGLSAAGRGGGDRLLGQLARVLEKAQAKDGSFSFAQGGQPSPYMTGQALYALRLAGRSDADASVVKGTRWLLERQRSDGSWSVGGFGKAEAMWAVLGLVSMDRISIDVAGLDDGTRLERTASLTARAADNGDSKVTALELYLDDVKVHAEKGSTLSYALDPKGLSDGLHLVDVVAKNAAGKESRRRLSFFAGEAWLTELGTRFDGGRTHVGVRSLTGEAQKGKVVVRVLESADKGGVPTKGKEVAVLEQTVAPGALSFAWDGTGKDGKPMRGSRFFAEVAYVDDKGEVRDTEEVLFTHDTLENQRQRYAEVAGRVALDEGGAAANTVIELVDKQGNVVQRTTSTRSGEYRFQNVDEGRYSVRVKKKGFRDWFADIEAKPAAEAEAPAATISAE